MDPDSIYISFEDLLKCTPEPAFSMNQIDKTVTPTSSKEVKDQVQKSPREAFRIRPNSEFSFFKVGCDVNESMFCRRYWTSDIRLVGIEGKDYIQVRGPTLEPHAETWKKHPQLIQPKTFLLTIEFLEDSTTEVAGHTDSSPKTRLTLAYSFVYNSTDIRCLVKGKAWKVLPDTLSLRTGDNGTSISGEWTKILDLSVCPDRRTFVDRWWWLLLVVGVALCLIIIPLILWCGPKVTPAEIKEDFHI